MPDTPAPLHRFYDNAADAYTRGRAGYDEDLIDRALKEAGLDKKDPKDVTIADIGSGSGLLAIALAKRGYHVIAVDPEEKMTQLLKANANAAGVGENITIGGKFAHDTGIAEHSVDLITAGTSAHWFAASDHAKEVSAHWKHILKDGGKAAFLYTLPSPNDPVAKLVDEALREGGALEKTELSKAYRKPVWGVFSNFDNWARYSNTLLEHKGYAFDSTRPVAARGGDALNAIEDYFHSNIALDTALKKSPGDWQLLVEHIKKALPEREPALQWDCQLFIGEPRTRPLEFAERLSPLPTSKGKGLFL